MTVRDLLEALSMTGAQAAILGGAAREAEPRGCAQADPRRSGRSGADNGI